MSIHVILETERLVFREFTTEDAPLIYELNLDPEITRYTLDPVRDIEHAEEILLHTILPQYKLYNHGRWAVLVKPALSFIGWCGLKTRPELSEVDLGYRFMKPAWGNGYATEAAKASLDHGFNNLGLDRIVGRALTGNAASIRVLEKCGMKFIGEQVVEGHLHRTYESLNPFIRS
ncbi:MAG TPA: GNAT family N-acetyltransferase [Chitinophagaceae bacterium]|nr:GNAT family N-acetyltransferase [Chitinophagaceae bacterium]HRG91539.1 GNAT family N-acetyltransferase [Chitinophagaceae bacterium]